MKLQVLEIRPNKSIQRVYLNCDSCLDMQRSDLATDQTLEIVCTPNCPDAELVLHGIVYRKNASHCFISCGGLLAKLPFNVEPNTNVYIGVTVQKKRGKSTQGTRKSARV